MQSQTATASMTTHRKPLLNATLMYVIAMAWFVAAIGCFVRNVPTIGAIFAAAGLLQLILAIVVDIKEGKKK